MTKEMNWDQWAGINQGADGRGRPPMTKVEDDYNSRVANAHLRPGNQMNNSGASVLGDNEHDTQPAPGAFGKELKDGEPRKGISKPGVTEGM